METLHIFTFLLFCVGAIVFVSATIYFLQGLEESDDDNDTMSGKNSSGMENVPDQRGTGGGGNGWNEISLPALLPRTAQTREVVTSTASGGPDPVHVQTTSTTPIVPPMRTTLKPPTTKPTTSKLTTLKRTTLMPTTLKRTTLMPTTPKRTTPEPSARATTSSTRTTPKATAVQRTTPKPTMPKPTTVKPTTPKPTTPKPTTPKPTTPKPTTLKPTTPKPKPTTPKPTTLKPTTRKRTTTTTFMPTGGPRDPGRDMNYESLICTVSVPESPEKLMIPKDGVCDFLFYDSLYMKFGDTLVKEPGPQLLTFLRAAASSKNTDYGCSVDIDHARTFSDHLRQESGKKRIVEMWKRNVFHYGFLTLDQFRSATPVIQEALSSLKHPSWLTWSHDAQDLTELLELAVGKTAVTVLGIYSPAKYICEKISSILGAQMFKPAAIIILGHISYNDWHSYACRILPPNVYGVSRDILRKMFYGHLFEDGVSLSRCITQKVELTVKIPVKVSVTLRGRRYRMKPATEKSFIGLGTFDLLNECSRAKQNSTFDQNAPAVRICAESEVYKRNVNFSEQYQTVITYDNSKGFTVTFDNDNSLRTKVCDAQAKHGSFGLAAYDVNYDQGDNVCPKWGAKGHYSRLYLVQRLNAFMNGKGPGGDTDCETLSFN